MRKLVLALAILLMLASAAHAERYVQRWCIIDVDISSGVGVYFFDFKLRHYEAVDPNRGPGDFTLSFKDGQGRVFWEDTARVRTNFTTHEVVSLRIVVPASIYDRAASYNMGYEKDYRP